MVRVLFALSVVLAVVAVLGDGIPSGLAALAAMVTFVLACAFALRRRGDVDDRAGLGGWVNGGF